MELDPNAVLGSPKIGEIPPTIISDNVKKRSKAYPVAMLRSISDHYNPRNAQLAQIGKFPAKAHNENSYNRIEHLWNVPNVAVIRPVSEWLACAVDHCSYRLTKKSTNMTMTSQKN